jgi:hypothetical protein
MTDVNVPGIVSNPPETRLRQILPTSTISLVRIHLEHTIVKFLVIAFDDCACDTGFVCSGFDHCLDLCEKVIEILIASFSKFDSSFILFVIREVTKYLLSEIDSRLPYGNVILIIL